MEPSWWKLRAKFRISRSGTVRDPARHVGERAGAPTTLRDGGCLEPPSPPHALELPTRRQHDHGFDVVEQPACSSGGGRGREVRARRGGGKPRRSARASGKAGEAAVAVARWRHTEQVHMREREGERGLGEMGLQGAPLAD